jgi:hypothetical protein
VLHRLVMNLKKPNLRTTQTSTPYTSLLGQKTNHHFISRPPFFEKANHCQKWSCRKEPSLLNDKLQNLTNCKFGGRCRGEPKDMNRSEPDRNTNGLTNKTGKKNGIRAQIYDFCRINVYIQKSYA